MPETALSTQDTPWTLILSAQGAVASPVLRRECLERIFSQYRLTIIRFFRQLGFRDYEDRDDLAQEFFLRFLEKDLLNRIDPEKGRFRAYLKAVARRFVYDVRYREKGRHPLASVPSLPTTPGQIGDIPLDPDAYPAADSDVFDAFDRQWARNSLETALVNFRRDCEERSLAHWMAIFERHTLPLADGAKRPTTAETAALLGQTSKQVESHLTRANAGFREHLRKVIRITVATDAEVEEEMIDLWRVLSGGRED